MRWLRRPKPCTSGGVHDGSSISVQWAAPGATRASIRIAYHRQYCPTRSAGEGGYPAHHSGTIVDVQVSPRVALPFRGWWPRIRQMPRVSRAGGGTMLFSQSRHTRWWVAIAAVAAMSSVAEDVEIPDVNLRWVIADTLGVDPDDPITTDQMATLTVLSKFGYYHIRDLTGLEHAIDLTSLAPPNASPTARRLAPAPTAPGLKRRGTALPCRSTAQTPGLALQRNQRPDAIDRFDRNDLAEPAGKRRLRLAAASPHFSPGAVMIAEDFGPVRVLATESIGAPDAARGTTVEGACARTGPKDPRGRGQLSPQSA